MDMNFTFELLVCMNGVIFLSSLLNIIIINTAMGGFNLYDPCVRRIGFFYIKINKVG